MSGTVSDAQSADRAVKGIREQVTIELRPVGAVATPVPCRKSDPRRVKFSPEIVDAFRGVVRLKDAAFFQNSVASVDRSMLVRGTSSNLADSRHVKTSSIAE